jgi:hypothetical protein
LRPQRVDDLLARQAVAVGQRQQMHELRRAQARPGLVGDLATVDRNREAAEQADAHVTAWLRLGRGGKAGHRAVSYGRAARTSAPAARNVSGTPRVDASSRQGAVSPAPTPGAGWRPHEEMAMNVRHVVFPMPDGRLATMSLPEPLTPESIDALEHESARVWRALRRDALAAQAQRQAREAGAIEFDSWALRA